MVVHQITALAEGSGTRRPADDASSAWDGTRRVDSSRPEGSTAQTRNGAGCVPMELPALCGGV